MKELIRIATLDDLADIAFLLEEDIFKKISCRSSEEINKQYSKSVKEIVNSDFFDIYVMELDGKIVGCMQLSYTPHLSFKGAYRGLIESVRVLSDYRRKGLGTKMIKFGIERIKDKGCQVLQLTSREDPDELRKIYESFGLSEEHTGYKSHYVDRKTFTFLLW